MSNEINSKHFEKYAKNYVDNDAKYDSKIINLLMNNSYSKSDLSASFDSKPTFYTKLKAMKKQNVLIIENDLISINGEFKSYLREYFVNHNYKRSCKIDNMRQEMLNACKDIERILRE